MGGWPCTRMGQLADVWPSCLPTCRRKYAAEVGHNVSALKRKAILERARQLNVNVTNPKARLRSQESE